MLISNEEAKRYIDNINFSKIIDKMVTSYGWLEEDAITTCKQYRHFLFLNKKYENVDLPPSEDIDEFWHNHILDTNNYVKDCEFIFGKYRHHDPFIVENEVGLVKHSNSFEKTKELYFKEFGEEIEATKSRYPKLVYYILKKLEKFQNRNEKSCNTTSITQV